MMIYHRKYIRKIPNIGSNSISILKSKASEDELSAYMSQFPRKRFLSLRDVNFYLTKLYSTYYYIGIVVVCCYGSDIICPKALIRSDQIEKYSFHLQFYSSLGSMIKLLFNERQLAWPLWLTIDITHTILINYIYLESCQHIQLQFTNNGTFFCLFKNYFDFSSE